MDVTVTSRVSNKRRHTQLETNEFARDLDEGYDGLNSAIVAAQAILNQIQSYVANLELVPDACQDIVEGLRAEPLPSNVATIRDFLSTPRGEWLRKYSELVDALRQCDDERFRWRSDESARVQQDERLREQINNDKVAIYEEGNALHAAELEKWKKERETYVQQLTELREQLSDAQSNVDLQVDARVKEITATLSTSEKNVAALNLKIVNLSGEVKRLGESLALEQAESKQLRESLKASILNAETCSDNLEKAQRLLDELSERNKQYEQHDNQMVVEANDQQKEADRLREEVASLREAQRVAAVKCETDITECDELRKQYKELESAKKTLDETYAQLLTKNTTLKQDLNLEKAEYELVKNQSDRYRTERNEAKKSIEELQKEVDKLKLQAANQMLIEEGKPTDRIKQLEEDLEAARKTTPSAYYRIDISSAQVVDLVPVVPTEKDRFQFYAILGQEQTLENKFNQLRKTIVSFQQEIVELSTENENQSGLIRDLQNDVNEQEREIERLELGEKKAKTATDEVTKAENKNVDLTAQLKRSQETIEALTRDMEAQRRITENVENQLNLLKEQKDLVDAQLFLGAPDVSTLRARIRVLELDIAGYKLEVAALRNQLSAQIGENDEQQVQIEGLADVMRVEDNRVALKEAEIRKLEESLSNVRTFFNQWNQKLREYKKWQLNAARNDLEVSTVSIRTAAKMIILRTKDPANDDEAEFRHILKHYRFMQRLGLYNENDVYFQPMPEEFITDDLAHRNSNYVLINITELRRLENRLRAEQEENVQQSVLLSSLDLRYKSKLLGAALSSTPSKRPDSLTLSFSTAEHGQQLSLVAHGLSLCQLPNSKRRAYVVNMAELVATKREYRSFGLLNKDYIHAVGSLQLTLGERTHSAQYRLDAPKDARHNDELMASAEGVDLYVRYVDGSCYRLEALVFYQ